MIQENRQEIADIFKGDLTDDNLIHAHPLRTQPRYDKGSIPGSRLNERQLHYFTDAIVRINSLAKGKDFTTREPVMDFSGLLESNYRTDNTKHTLLRFRSSWLKTVGKLFSSFTERYPDFNPVVTHIRRDSGLSLAMDGIMSSFKEFAKGGNLQELIENGRMNNHASYYISMNHGEIYEMKCAGETLARTLHHKSLATFPNLLKTYDKRSEEDLNETEKALLHRMGNESGIPDGDSGDVIPDPSLTA